MGYKWMAEQKKRKKNSHRWRLKNNCSFDVPKLFNSTHGQSFIASIHTQNCCNRCCFAKFFFLFLFCCPFYNANNHKKSDGKYNGHETLILNWNWMNSKRSEESRPKKKKTCIKDEHHSKCRHLNTSSNCSAVVVYNFYCLALKRRKKQYCFSCTE